MPLSYRRCVVWDGPGGLNITWGVDDKQATDVREDGLYDTAARGERLVYPERATPETDDEFMRRVAEGGPSVGALTPDAGAVPLGVPYRIEDGQTVKAWNEKYRVFRRDGCCSADLTIDMPKAREIWRNEMRKARTPLLEELDIEYMRATESGDTQKRDEAVSQKQELRDLPSLPEIDAAQTPDELMAVWPEILGGALAT